MDEYHWLSIRPRGGQSESETLHKGNRSIGDFVSGQVKLYERACHHIYILLAETKVIVNSNQLSGSTVSVVLIPLS